LQKNHLVAIGVMLDPVILWCYGVQKTEYDHQHPSQGKVSIKWDSI